jgi:Ca2+-transporting ATPase
MPEHLPPSSATWHTLTAAEAAGALGSDTTIGLNAAEVGERRQRHGSNSLPEAHRRSVVGMALGQFRDFMILALLGAAVIAGIIGEATDALTIVVIVVLNAVIGFVQEWRAERAMSALRKLAAPLTRVRRGGAVASIPAEELVPGDIVLLEAGNLVPADLRLFEAAQLRIAEATLTGESQASDKITAALQDSQLALGDRSNMAYRGTVVAHGRAAGIVVATGIATELGRIAQLLVPDQEAKTPLQRRLAMFGTRLAWSIVLLCAVVFLIGLLRGEAPLLMFLTAVSLAVAAIPEALPAVVGIALALGAHRMAHRNALIRRLLAVETLGSVTIICSDKTGTLTQNRMRVEEMWVDASDRPPFPLTEPWTMFFRALALSNDVVADPEGRLIGDPTEVAMLEAARAAGTDKPESEARWPRIAEIPFDPAQKRMTTFHADGDGVVAFVKGAPEALLPLCARRLTETGSAALEREETLKQAARMAADGLRVLAVAVRRSTALPATDAGNAQGDLDLIGLVGLLDPPRPEAAQAVAECRTAGIVPVMITGDHPATARSIAWRLGICGPDDPVITGAELASLSDEILVERAATARVYARVSPEQKIRIVRALQARGHVVAMTGDGVNDAPALRSADIGVAMGMDGTDVAREAAHMVLLDDNFATIVHAVREGRRILDNIRKFIRYVMTGNVGEIATIMLAQLLGTPLPLLPIQILWINLVTDGLPGLALAGEAAEQGIMQRPPQPVTESIFAHGTWQHILWVGLSMGAVCMLAQLWGLNGDARHAQSMVFTVLTIAQLGHVLAIRRGHAPFMDGGIFANPALFAAVAFTFALQMAALYVPALSAVLGTKPLTAAELGSCIGLSFVIVAAVEVEKWRIRNRLRRRYHGAGQGTGAATS